MGYQERVAACFRGLATGDALGKQTETLSRNDVLKWYPGGITGFHGTPGDVIPRYAGKRYEWRIGETTDDTEQTLAVARSILASGQVRHTSVGQELLRCRKSAHPGVSLWAFLEAGDPNRIAASGNGCGAAMRVAPVGILYPPHRLDDLLEGARQSAMPTHGGPMAIAAAAAVACAVSAAVHGLSKEQVLAAALAGARSIEPVIAGAITAIYTGLASMGRLEAGAIAQRHFPNRPETIVPLAISLALVTESAEETMLLAANTGGDTDSVASIGGAIAAGLRPDTVNLSWYEIVKAVNPQDDVDAVASALASLRLAEHDPE